MRFLLPFLAGLLAPSLFAANISFLGPTNDVLPTNLGRFRASNVVAAVNVGIKTNAPSEALEGLGGFKFRSPSIAASAFYDHTNSRLHILTHSSKTGYVEVAELDNAFVRNRMGIDSIGPSTPHPLHLWANGQSKWVVGTAGHLVPEQHASNNIGSSVSPLSQVNTGLFCALGMEGLPVTNIYSWTNIVSGRVGIGTNAPGAPLHVAGGSLMQSVTSDTLRLGFRIGPSNTWLVFDGDSITSGTGANTQPYPYALTNSLLTNSWAIFKTNAAVAGASISDRITAYAANVSPYKPDSTHDSIVFFLCGINDINGGTSVATVEARLTNYWGLARADGFKIVAFTVMDHQTLSVANQQNRMEINAFIRQSGALYDFLVDLDAIIPIANNGVTIDGIHLNNTSSWYVANCVMDVLTQPTKINSALPFNSSLSGSGLKIVQSTLFQDNARGLLTSTRIVGLVPSITFEDTTGDAFLILPYNGDTKMLWKDGAGNFSTTTDMFLQFGTTGLLVGKSTGFNTNSPVTQVEVFSTDPDGIIKATSPHGTAMHLATNGIVSFRTNAVAPTPIAGMYSLWSSNYALYLVTPNKTNLISDGN